ncbi:MAG: PDDEXK nuclease domain-containing protein [Prevotella sp.]|nr:PDDEXK nuclease domain-containing protein [Prevotella sp.]
MAGNMTLATNRDFKSWVSQLKQDIRSAQIKAAIKVNTELLRLYWRMGADICEKQKSASWGDGWLKELSRELMTEFPDMKGFSHRNLQYIRQWYLFYNQEHTIVQQVVAQLEDVNVQQPVAKLDNDMRQQPVAQISEDVFFSVPWGHHLYIISQCKDVSRAVFYLKKTVENGWSRAVLLNYLDTNLYERQGKAVNNFNRLLANPQSELAAQTLKDPYNFDFLTLDGEYRERELEHALTHNVTRFLLELGTGFAFVGSQVPLQVGEDTVYPDLLFYHLELRCYVVVELKVTKFKGEHLGQLGVYVSAVNHIKKKPTDNPTIGLLICKTKNNVMAQYALESTNQPIGISEYQLSKLMPEHIQSQLPTIEDIEATLSDNDDNADS